MIRLLQILACLLVVLSPIYGQGKLYSPSEFKKKLISRIHFKDLKPFEKTAQLDKLSVNLRTADLKMRLDSFVYFDSTAALNTFKSIYFYDSKQQNTVIDFYIWDTPGKKWMGFIHAVFLYNTKGQIIETQGGDWNTQTNTFDISSKVLRQYNAKGILIKDSTYVFDSGAWALDEKNEYTLTNDKVTVAVQSDYDGVNWVYYSKHEYKYDGSENLIEDLESDWDPTTLSWQEDAKTITIYNSDNKVTEQIISSWDFNTSKFENDTRIQTTYDGFGLKINQLQQDWDQLNSTWLNIELFEVSYSQAKNPTKILIYSWDKTNSTWKNINLFLNTFDESVNGSNLILPQLDIFYLLFQFDAFANGRPLHVAYYEQKRVTGEWKSRNRITFHYSQHVVNLLSEAKKNTLRIHPNPAGDYLLCESEIMYGNFTITSTEGIIKSSGDYVYGESIQVSNLPAGTYILSLQDKRKCNYQTQFIKL